MTTATILTIDDEERSRSAIENLLHGQTYRLEFAHDGPSGLQRARELLPDLIILDVMMPGMSGFDVCQAIRADKVLQQIPVVMLTALDDSDSRLEGLNAGADDFLSKPFVRKEILAKINTILKLNRYRQLRAENSLLQWVLNQSRDAYLVLNADSHIVYANQTARTYLGLDQDQLPQEDVFEIIWRQFNLVPIEAWTQEPAEQTVARYLVRPETAMSPAFWLQFEELPEYEELQNKRVVCLRDVSTQVNTSTEMRKFQTMLSHKLNTPLSGIWGGMQILKHTLQTKPDSEVFDLLYLIESSAHRLKRDISEVLDYTFASSVARHGNNFCLKNLHALLVETISELQIDHFNLAMHSDLSNVSVVLSDKAMYLIVFELLENAKKFHPRRTPSVDISLRQVNNHITMQFTDDGITLSPQQLQAVLRPYTQGEKHFTGEVDGMGLGLSLVSNLVWQSGGEISIKNRSDKPGFEVDMLLPLAASAVVEPQPAQPTEASV